MLFGVATAFGYCRGGNLGQCAAHYIMGSAFIGYAAILVIMLNVGGDWLKRRGCSQELLDSSVILVWVSRDSSSLGRRSPTGNHQHLHGASRRAVDAQRHAAYDDGASTTLAPVIG